MTQKYRDRDPEEEIIRAYKLFVNEDPSGKINIRNLRKITKELGENIDDDELQAMIDEFDLDQDGMIGEEEFINIIKSHNAY